MNTVVGQGYSGVGLVATHVSCVSFDDGGHFRMQSSRMLHLLFHHGRGLWVRGGMVLFDQTRALQVYYKRRRECGCKLDGIECLSHGLIERFRIFFIVKNLFAVFSFWG